MKILYRELKEDDLSSLKEIDRRQEISEEYVLDNKILSLRNKTINIEKWNEQDLLDYTNRLKNIYNSGGFIYGAFVNRDNLVGLIAVDYRFLDKEKEYINLDLLYVSYGYRHCGIGTTLIKKALREAKKTDANYIYISSSNFKETVDFYIGLGAEITKPIEKMYKLEPYDIHMRIDLKK